MSVDIRVPTLGESVTEATIARWLKKAGDQVAADEPLVELETDKVSLEVPAPSAGVLAEIAAEDGSDVEVGAIIGRIEAAGAGQQPAPPAKESPAEPMEKAAAAPKADAKPLGDMNPAESPMPKSTDDGSGDAAGNTGPAARKIAEERNIDIRNVPPSGPKNNVTKGDVLAFPGGAQQGREAPAPAAPKPATEAPAQPRREGRVERVRMTRLRKRIAERLKEAQNTAAMLTTFNEVDMTAIMDLRQTYQESFTKKHGVKLGFMGFFVKASIEALRAFPAANAEIDGDDIVFKHYYDIGVAVSTSQGLVVPVVRDAEIKGLAEIEKTIGDLGKRARDGKLAMEELTGGTFSITNGGIFGSLMSTPILNPPQVAILGMHKIQQRPMVMPDGGIEARPMMYLALSYDHRIIDGREAVSFLVRLKECIEDPQRMLLDA